MTANTVVTVLDTVAVVVVMKQENISPRSSKRNAFQNRVWTRNHAQMVAIFVLAVGEAPQPSAKKRRRHTDLVFVEVVLVRLPVH